MLRERLVAVEALVLFFAGPFVDQSPQLGQFRYACAGEIAVCNALFHSTMSCFPMIIAMKWQYKVVRNLSQSLMFRGHVLGGGARNF